MLLHRHKSKVLSSCVCDGVLGANFLSNNLGFSMGLRDWDSGPQSANGAPLHVVAVGDVVGDAGCKPDTWKLLNIGLRWKQQFKSWGQYAHYHRWWSKRGGHRQWFANYRPIATKALLKVFVTKDSHGGQRRWRVGTRSRICCRSRLRSSIRILKVSASKD